MVGQEGASGGSNMGEKRCWTSDELRRASYHWSLAGDAALLDKLQDMAQKIISRTHQIQQEVDNLDQTTAATHSKLGNVVNDFLMLSNTQFVENRVYDEEISDPSSLSPSESKREEKKTKEEQKEEIIGKVSVALRLGMSVIETAYEQLHVQDTDSEDEEAEPYAHEPILHPKDPYQSRPLPCIIGSTAFQNDDYVGISSALLSEDEHIEADAESISSFEERGNFLPKDYTSDENEDDVDEDDKHEDITRLSNAVVPKQNDYDQRSNRSGEFDLFDSKTKTESEEEDIFNNDDDAVTNPSKTDFRKELAGKLKIPRRRTRSNSDNSDESRDTTRESPASRKSSSASRDLVTSRRDSSQSENRRLERNNIVKEAEEEEEEDDDDEGLFTRKSLFSKKSRLFDNSNDEDEDMFFGSSSQKKAVKSDVVATKKPSFKSETPSKLSSSKSDSLFDDDDDGDLFSNATPSKTVANKEKHGSIFHDDDEDLFIGSSKKGTVQNVSTPTKKILPGAVSMFGSGVNPLSLKHPKLVKDDDRQEGGNENGSPGSRTSFKSIQSASLKDAKKGSPSNSASSSSTALFADEPDGDDLFSNGESVLVKRKPIGGISLFEDDDADDSGDIFISKTKEKVDDGLPSKSNLASGPSKEITTETRSKKLGLFDDDVDDDIFGDSIRSKKTSKKGPTKTLIEDVPKEKSVKPAARLKVSLFDDDEDAADLFGPSSNSSSSTTPSSSTIKTKTKATGKSLFDDDSLLFGSSANDNLEVDLFGRSTVSSSSSSSFSSSIMKDEAKQEDVSSSSTATGFKSNLLAVDHDDDNDLFSKKSKTSEFKNVSKTSSKVTSKGLETKEKVKVTKELLKKDEISTKESIPVPSGNIETTSESPRKKPVGGVALFGGAVPSLLKPQQRPVSPSRHETTTDRKNVLTPERRSPSPFGESLILPSKEAAVGFDQPVETNPLHNANKDRIKIQVKRRPPTRRGRQEAIRKSAIDVIGGDIIEDFLHDGSTTASAPTSPVSSDSGKVAEFTASLKRSENIVNVNKDRPSRISPPPTTTMVTSPSTEEEDLFPIETGRSAAAAPDKLSSRGLSKSLFGEGGGSSSNEDTDDLFNTKPKLATSSVAKSSLSLRHKTKNEEKSSIVAKNSSISATKSDLFDNLERDSTNDLFSTKPLTSKVKSNESNDLFDTESKTTKKHTNMTRGKSLFDDESDDDEDIFKMSSSSKKNTTVSKTQSSKSVSSTSTSSSSSSSNSTAVKSKTANLFDDPLMVNRKD